MTKILKQVDALNAKKVAAANSAIPTESVEVEVEDEDTAIVNQTIPSVDISKINQSKRKTSIKKANVFVIGFNRKTISVINEFNN